MPLMLSSRRTVLRALAGGAALLGGSVLRAQSERILLAQSAPFTGPAAQLGIQFHQGARLYFEQLNARGGVRGRPVEIVKMDDGYEPDRCVENTRKLIALDPLALFAYVGTPTSVVALPLATEARVPFFAPFTGAMGLRQPFNRYAFHVRASYNDETELIVKQLTFLGLKKIAVFYQNDAYGKAGLDGVQLALTKRQMKPIATAHFERNTVAVAPAVKALVAAQRTVEPDRYVHSLHGYFMRPGDIKVPIIYEVDRIRDGGSFTTRRVLAIQHGQAIFSLEASFQVDEKGLEHQFALPDDVPPPEGLQTQRQLLEKAERVPEAVRRFWALMIKRHPRELE